MLRSPSSRRKGSREQINLNLVPILDTMVTLIGFILFTTSFLALVHIESPFPQASTENNEIQLKEKPLQLTVTLNEGDVEVWSPFERIAAKHIPNVPAKEGANRMIPDTKALHDALLTIKQQFPLETKVVIVPSHSTSYDILISVMDSMRMMEPTDPPLFEKNPVTQVDEAVKILFPEVIFGNLLGDS